MTHRTDLITGSILLVISVLWCWGVVSTIPSAEDTRLGARGFPLGLGVLLGALGAVLAAKSSFTKPARTASLEPHKDAPEFNSGDAGLTKNSNPSSHQRSELWAVVSTVALLLLYAFLLEYTGFIIATFLTVAIAVGVVFGLWRWRLLLGMSVGISVGVYLIFGKLLSVYLPFGKWINLAF